MKKYLPFSGKTLIDVKEKICSIKSCTFKGKPQPIEEFKKYNGNRDKRMATCETCYNKKHSKNEKVYITHGFELYC